jgi:hypothetical protein
VRLREARALTRFKACAVSQSEARALTRFEACAVSQLRHARFCC